MSTRSTVLPILLLILSSAQFAAFAEDYSSQWIWTAETGVPVAGERYFRRVFALGRSPASATLTIACDDQYEVYINGKLAGAGNEWRLPGVFSVGHLLVKGTNVIGVKAAKDIAGSAGLIVDLDGGNDFRLVSDKSWVSYKTEVGGWMQSNFDSEGWKPCREIGHSDVAPWSLKGWPKNVPHIDDLAAGKGNFVNGFRVPDGFVVEQFAGDNFTSSVLCMTFNGNGQLLTAAAGSGPTEIRILDTLNGYCTGSRVFYPGLHCQGMCAVGTDLYVVGNGKLFYLKDQNGHADSNDPLSPEMLGSMTEHGPHAIVRGPDGHFYIMLGNDSSFKMSHFGETSPVREENLYWGNLLPLQSSSFMDGVGPPGGRLLRTDIKGKEWELIAHGFRNDYDFAFASTGEIFGYDSDMEYDIGLPWYRANRVVHVPIGANFGWRYGSGKWKNHTPDSVPPMSETGRGSPTGVEVYNHTAFPEEYRDAIFLCDWSRARILVVNPKRDGATWKGEPREFLAVRGINFPVTDACVGPDGAMYFSYGGRGAKGGVIRVRYVGGKAMGRIFNDTELKGISGAVALALNTPQYQSAFGRSAIARLKQSAGTDWNWQVAAIARDPQRPDAVRGRALDFLGMDGDIIDPVLLGDLAKDKSAFMRAQAVMRITLNGDPAAHGLLKTMLSDEDPWVQRRACEGLLSFSDAAAAEKLVDLLGHTDRFVRYAASNALLRLPANSWSPKVVAARNPMIKEEGLLTLAQSFQSSKIDQQKFAPQLEEMLNVEADGLDVLALTKTAGSDDTLILLRAISLTLLARADPPPTLNAGDKAKKATIPADLNDRLVARCSALLNVEDRRIAMDAAEILGFLGDGKAIAPLIEKLKNELSPRDERIHYACVLSNIPNGWTAPAVSELVEFLAAPGPGENGYAFAANLKQCGARLSKNLPVELRTAAFNALTPDTKSYAMAIQGFNEMNVSSILDEFKKAKDNDARKQLLGKIALVGNDEAFHALESLADTTSPFYDTLVTLLMRFKHVEAKKYATIALSSPSRGLAGDALNRVLELYKEDPEDQNLYFGLVACAARSNDSRAAALALLKKWPIDDKAVKDLPANPEDQVAFWAKIYKQNYKNDKRNFPDFSGEGYQDPAKFQKLDAFIKANPPGKTGDVEAGKTLFKSTAKCINCHTFKKEGQQLGPELTDVAKRFDSSKILEDIVYPSKVVDARYRQIVFKTKDGQRIAGFASAETDDSVSVTNSEAVTVTLKKADIETKTATDKSIMPDGLLDALTPEQIRDLLAFLESGK